MSRSKRKAIIKDKPRNRKRTSMYWRPIRRTWRNSLRSIPRNMEVTWWQWCDPDVWDILNNVEFKHQRSIIDDYDYCDYIVDYEYNRGWFSPDDGIDKEQKKLLSRK